MVAGTCAENVRDFRLGHARSAASTTHAYATCRSDSSRPVGGWSKHAPVLFAVMSNGNKKQARLLKMLGSNARSTAEVLSVAYVKPFDLLVGATNVEFGCETNSNIDAVVRSATPMTSSRFSKSKIGRIVRPSPANDVRRGNRRNSRRRTALDRDRVAMAGTVTQCL